MKVNWSLDRRGYVEPEQPQYAQHAEGVVAFRINWFVIGEQQPAEFALDESLWSALSEPLS